MAPKAARKALWRRAAGPAAIRLPPLSVDTVTMPGAGLARSAEGMAATVGTIRFEPNAINAIPSVAAFVVRTLRSFGIEVAEGIGGTGVIGTLRRGTSNRSIVLRADMDALRIRLTSLASRGTSWKAAVAPFQRTSYGPVAPCLFLMQFHRCRVESAGPGSGTSWLRQPQSAPGRSHSARLLSLRGDRIHFLG